MMMIRKSFKIPIFEAKVVLIVADDIVDLILRKDSEATVETEKDTKAYTFMRWPDAEMLIRSDDLTHNTICHESDHIAHWIMREVGVKESETSEEAYAYMSGYIFEQIAKILKRAGLKIK